MNDSERTSPSGEKTAPVGIFHADLDGNIIFANPAMAMVGLRTGELGIENWLAHIHPDDLLQATATLRHVVRNVTAGSHAYRILGPHGEVRWVQAQIAPILDRNGRPRGFAGTLTDITAERELRQKMDHLAKRYASLLELLPAGVFEARVDGSALYDNPAMRDMTGLGKPEADMQEWLSVLHPEDRDQLLEAWQQAAATRGKFSARYRYRYPDGRIAWAQASAVPRFDEQGEFQGFLGIVLDVTRDQQHQQRIEQLSRLYETLSRVNAATVRCDSEAELFQEIARVFVRFAGFENTILFEFVPEQGDTPRAVTGFFRDDALDHTDIVDALRNEEHAPPLTRAALATGKIQIANDYPRDPRAGPYWGDLVAAHSVGSLAVIPFTCLGKIAAVLILSAGERDYFSADIAALLEEIMGDVSHALETLVQKRQHRLAEAELARNEERLRISLDLTRTGTYQADYRINRISVDAIGMHLLGLGEAALDTDIESFIALFPQPQRERMMQVHLDLMSGQRSDYTFEDALMLAEGQRWVRNHGVLSAERTAKGGPARLVGVISDITSSMMLDERDRLAATVFDNSGEAIMIIGPDFHVLMVNQVFTRMYGFSAAEIQGCSVTRLRSKRYDTAFYDSLAAAVQREGGWQGELWRRRKNGEEFPVLLTASVVKNRMGQIAHYVLHEMDISLQKESEARISYLAYRDSLTDLPNRALLRDRVEQSIAAAHRDGGTLALLFLDLDHFKNINDSLGHIVGDHLLKETASRLTQSVREMDTVGRLGGDEFLLLLPGADADAAGHVAQKLLLESSRSFSAGPHALTITPSIGIAMYPKDGQDFDELLKSADTAMYQAKDDGRNAYRFFTSEMNQAVFQRMVLESSLRLAIERNEFVLHYQPKFELAGQRLVGVEALIRWQQPEMGVISPARFIPVAEDSGLIAPIGKWVLEEACRQIRYWREQYAPDLCVAVNFSARQFASRDVVSLVAAALEKTGVPGCALEMEITESLLAQDLDYSLEVFTLLKRLGVRISVDDFGTGYSSLSYLKRFPLDRLKIDQSFVRELVSDADDRAIATAVVTLGHALGLRVIAEGVETMEQMDILAALGCDEVQGYLVGRPIPAADMTQALKKFCTDDGRGA